MLQAFLQKVVSPTSPWTLQSLPGFPYIRFTENTAMYEEFERWYEGQALLGTTTSVNTKKPVDQYPIRINPIKSTVRKHVSVLFGSNIDAMLSGGVPVRFVPDIVVTKSSSEKKDGKPSSAKKETEDKDLSKPSEKKTSDGKGEGSDTLDAIKEQETRVADAIASTFNDNGGGSLFYQNGSLAQYMGGCVFVAKWIPSDARIEITNPNPKEFVGIPDGRDFWRLKEAWIIQEITSEDLFSYNLNGAIPPTADPSVHYYIEHWTRTEYQVQIDGVDVLDGNGTPYSGPNPWGVVPIVYIPHMRTGTKFLGDSMITEAVKGLVKEMNNAWTDVSDAVNDDAHQMVASRNIRGTMKTVRVDNRTIIDLGASAGMGVGEGNPDLFGVKIQSASETMLNYGHEVDKQYRREVDHPAVADGEDEGSQRSSLTLNTRMWSLESHAGIERIFWSIGLIHFAKILLTIMADKGLKNIVEKDVETPLIVQWRSMLPKDRAEVISEIQVRDATKSASKRHLMEMAGDIRDPDAMFEEIVAESTELAKTEPKVLTANQAGGEFGKTPEDQNDPDLRKKSRDEKADKGKSPKA